MIEYLIINSLGNKINYHREMFFPDAQFHIDGYQFPPFLQGRVSLLKE